VLVKQLVKTINAETNGFSAAAIYA